MLAASREAGMGQQHDGRCGGARQHQAVDMQTGMRTAGGAKQHVELAAQQFGEIVGELQRHRIVADGGLTQPARRNAGRLQ